MCDATAEPAAPHEGAEHEVSPMGASERAVDDLLRAAQRAQPQELPALFNQHAAALGVGEATAYLADLQQAALVPFVETGGPGLSHHVDPLAVDSTVAGRAFQLLEVLTQDINPPGAGARVWFPLLSGSERLGVLAVSVDDRRALDADGGVLGVRLRRFASLAAGLIMTKTLYGDTLVRVRRQAEMGLSAEIQWGLLPPLAFASDQVTIAAALEPAYEVAGDSVDYAVDAGFARFAVFDGMGHSLQSAQLATVAVAAYRNARRLGQPLMETARSVDRGVSSAFGGDAFTTAILAELATETGLLSWVSAGHPEPLLLRHGRMIKSLHVEPSLPFGIGLDFGGDAPGVHVGVEQLEPGDQVLLYTDGVVEARSPQGEFFGLARLVDLLSQYLVARLPAPESMRRLVRALLEHQQSQLTDDATLLLADWRRPSDGLVP
jgi:serine phosphatase RsbU (regulator of sigma subunit)